MLDKFFYFIGLTFLVVLSATFIALIYGAIIFYIVSVVKWAWGA